MPHVNRYDIWHAILQWEWVEPHVLCNVLIRYGKSYTAVQIWVAATCSPDQPTIKWVWYQREHTNRGTMLNLQLLGV